MNRSIARLGCVCAAALLAALPVFAPVFADDFLRATSRELNAREKAALESCITDLGNPDPVLRSRAVKRLAAIGRPALPALIEALHKGSDPKQVRNVCLALGALGDATSLAPLERWFLEETPGEEAARAALFALARGKARLSPDPLSERLRELMIDAPLSTVREAALLCAGARKVGSIPETLRNEIKSERLARVRGCMLVALAESDDPGAVPLIVWFLDGRNVRDEKIRRAALYATARCDADPTLLKALLHFEPGDHEIQAYAVALGAFPEPLAVERLGRLLVREKERASLAVFSLANSATLEAKEWLSRALAGEFSEKVRVAAAYAVVNLTDQQRFLPKLRELAAANPGEPAKSAALLTLARWGDGEAAATIAQAVALWRDREMIERGLLLCSTTLPDLGVQELLPEARAAPVLPLWKEIADIQAGRRHPLLLQERIAAALTAARAHWTLARDDQRTAVLRDLLELDKVVFVEPRNGDGGGDGSPPPNPPNNGGGGGGSGGGDGTPPGDGGGGDGSGGGDGAPPGGDPGGNAGPPAQPRRSRQQDQTRIELDLRQWLIDFPPFELADPFAR